MSETAAPVTRRLESPARAVLSRLVVTDAAGASSQGRRAANEDNWRISGDVYVVADGIGGQEGGHVAAAVTVTELPDLVTEHLGDWSLIARRVSAAIADAGHEHGYPRPGSTFVVAVVHEDRVVVAYAGDSRAYRYRDGELRQLTFDHNVRWSMLDEGHTSDSGVVKAELLDALTSSVGVTDREAQIDAISLPVQPGDRFLLCTDGIHDYLAPRQIRAALDLDTCAGACAQLTGAAESAGGFDNATALVIEVGREGNA